MEKRNYQKLHPNMRKACIHKNLIKKGGGVVEKIVPLRNGTFKIFYHYTGENNELRTDTQDSE